MINFRFHIASLIAVFLALALGVLMGYGVLSQPTVSGLQHRIDTVENNANERKRENDDLHDQLSQLQGYVDGTAPFATAGRLDGVTVVVLAARGVNADSVTKTVELLRQAGAKVPCVFWLEPKWSLSNATDVKALADAIDKTERNPAALRADAWTAVAQRLAVGDAAAQVGSDRPDVLQRLSDAGFIKLEGVGDVSTSDFSFAGYPGRQARALLIAGTGEKVSAAVLINPAAGALGAAKVPTVAGEVFQQQDNGPDRGALLADIRSDQSLAQLVSTVDDLDLEQGRVISALGLADLGRGVVGHYGYGAGATRSVPAWPNP
jgi:Copper transport outer membrane protein, MctB